MHPQSTCSIPGCDKPADSLGLCLLHYTRQRRHGDPLATAYDAGRALICSVDGCEKHAVTRGWCHTHYNRWKRTGDPTLARRRGPQPVPLWDRIEKTETCWLWLGTIDSDGYGVLGDGQGKNVKAHRTVYELVVGPIPAGLTLDHLCAMKHCVNPAHLEPVTFAENARRARLSRRSL